MADAQRSRYQTFEDQDHGGEGDGGVDVEASGLADPSGASPTRLVDGQDGRGDEDARVCDPGPPLERGAEVRPAPPTQKVRVQRLINDATHSSNSKYQKFIEPDGATTAKLDDHDALSSPRNADCDRVRPAEAKAEAPAGVCDGDLLAPTKVGKPDYELERLSPQGDEQGGLQEPENGTSVTVEDSKASHLAVVDDARLSSSRRTFINAVVCFIGSGMYGLPIAFQRVGLLGGVLVFTFVAVVSLHCMFLVVDCKVFLEVECSKNIKTYGDIGYYAFGQLGARTVDTFIMLTQIGFCVAYLIVIADSMSNIIVRCSKRLWILLCMPLLVRASWLRSLKSMAPLSLLGELGQLLAASTVILYVMQFIVTGESEGGPPEGLGNQTANKSLNEADAMDALLFFDASGIPYFFGVSIYCFEGVGMVIPVRNSMKNTVKFKLVWGLAVFCVTFINGAVGLLGYVAFRERAEEIILNNLPQVHATTMVKVAFCVGLFFTYPIMMFPVIELFEEFLGRASSARSCGSTAKWNAMRSAIVLATGIVAALVPKFTFFIALVGASGSTMLALVLPSAFHLKLRYREMNFWQCWRECVCIGLGLFGGVLGTMSAVADLLKAM
mmetsp:Transcript_88142/g.247934  ORF Transcript_88142/g.247934 Transcript_88142/m.247934 type:complete len:611 (+) Transcript_88142:174-2006(+)|eukprot:CAMPEP_0117502424 /NCGR_PEP_ID=MMETSP0784-20121206/23806_1 /TAXON_ID=39447 /ORGANISM="" /LENGTH=610 /DNA_ID=CAMNT_0005297707 /DNA_START=176 /DNA_END=2008 /DNA_ORIENTATION=+